MDAHTIMLSSGTANVSTLSWMLIGGPDATWVVVEVVACGDEDGTGTSVSTPATPTESSLGSLPATACPGLVVVVEAVLDVVVELLGEAGVDSRRTASPEDDAAGDFAAATTCSVVPRSLRIAMTPPTSTVAATAMTAQRCDLTR